LILLKRKKGRKGKKGKRERRKKKERGKGGKGKGPPPPFANSWIRPCILQFIAFVLLDIELPVFNGVNSPS